MRTLLIMASVPVLLASPARAADRAGFQSIKAGDFATAEQTLLIEQRIHPNRPELMLNLAAVYAKTDRQAAARALYSDILARSPVAVDLPSGAVASSHDVARAGIDRLNHLVIASR